MLDFAVCRSCQGVFMLVVRAILVLSASVIFSHRAAAGQCDPVLISEVIERTGGSFERYSPRGTNVFLKHPYMDSFTLDCAFPAEPMVSGYWSRNAFPPSQFFSAVAAAASALSSERADRIEAGLRQCNRKALAQPSSEMDMVDAGLAHIECHSFTRDGGSVGFSVTKRKRR